MEASAILGGVAVLTSGAAAALIAYESAALVRRRVRIVAGGSERDVREVVARLVAWRIRNGFAVLNPLASWALGFGPLSAVADEGMRWCIERGQTATRCSITTLLLAGAFVFALAISFIAGSAVAGVAMAATLIMLMVVWSAHRSDKRSEQERDGVAPALESLASCMGSGMTLVQTFRQVSKDVGGTIGEAFARCAHLLDAGGGAHEALAELKRSVHAPEIAFVAVALDVHHQAGGSLREVLAATAESAKSELELRRSLRIQTAQAKLSARIVSVMPLILVAAFSVISPGFLAPFFESAAGFALLGIAVAMQLAGIALVRRALKVAGVS